MARLPVPRSRGGDLVLVALLVLVCGLGLRLEAEAASARTDAEAAAAAFTAATAPSAAQERRSLWFGDSIVEGCCRERPGAPSMAQAAADALGWALPVVQGSGGTGYTTAGPIPGRRPYTDRFQREVKGVRTDVVIIEGGGNDPDDSEPLRQAVRRVLEEARKQFPQALIVVLGPYSPDGTGYEVQREVIGEQAEEGGFPFIDQVALGWMQGRPEYLSEDGFHPNAAGHAYLGGRVAEALADALEANSTPDEGVDG